MHRAAIRPELAYAWYGPSLLVTNNRGECGADQALTGYFFRETRFLRGLRLELDGRRPWLCALGSGDQHSLAFSLTYPEELGYSGGGSGTGGDEIPRNEEGIPHRALELLARYRVTFRGVEITVRIHNRAPEPIGIELAWRVEADYADLFEALQGSREIEAPVTQSGDEGGGLRFRQHHPALPFETEVRASGPGEWAVCPGSLVSRVELPSRQARTVGLMVMAHDFERTPDRRGEDDRQACARRWHDATARLRAPGDASVERMVTQAVTDLGSLALLEGEPDEWLAPAAGIPLYPALFGRDSLTTSWQAALFDRGRLLEATLTRLQGLQGATDDPAHDEMPGRIVHSVRRGPLARLGTNPFGRYYGDFASPLMFVISLAHLYAWTGDTRDVARHWDAARRALDWARERGDLDGDGYLEYRTLAEQGPKNQGWKDSGEGILYDDGRQVPPPIATCEVQGYWYAAQQLAAVLSAAQRRFGDAKAYWRAAADLKARFNRDWWLPKEGFLALALDPDKRPVASIGSNAGHCLTAGIIEDEHVAPVVGRLFAPDMFSGWGIRTLSSEHPSYNPIGYHLGSVWAVENATIGFGLRRYGFDTRYLDLMEGMLDLARLYGDNRVPECVGGYSRAEFPHPGAYPQANAPQAWNQSALLLLMHSVLGLQPVAPLDLLVVDPVLPAWLPEIVLDRLQIGGATVTLRFYRDSKGESHVEVVRKRGTLHLVKQPPPESLTATARDRFTALVDRVLHH